MNRAILKFISSSSRVVPRIYAGTTVGAKGHHGSGDAQHHHHDDHGHGHGAHHHEPELRKTQTWRHHSGINSKYENQSEDPTIEFTQETPNYHDYRSSGGNIPVLVPYRTHASMFSMRHYHLALVLSIWLWWYIAWRFSKESSYFFGHAHFPDMSTFTDEELGIPPDDLD